VAEVRKVRTERDHVVAETNEIVADLFSGRAVYVQDMEKVMSDRSSGGGRLIGAGHLEIDPHICPTIDDSRVSLMMPSELPPRSHALSWCGSLAG
jgi:hypothetical protein